MTHDKNITEEGKSSMSNTTTTTKISIDLKKWGAALAILSVLGTALVASFQYVSSLNATVVEAHTAKVSVETYIKRTSDLEGRFAVQKESLDRIERRAEATENTLSQNQQILQKLSANQEWVMKSLDRIEARNKP